MSTADLDDRIDLLLTDLERCDHAGDRALLRETLRLLRDDLSRRVENQRHAEDRYRLAIDTAEIGLFDWDLRTQQITWNEHHARIFGVAPDRFDGHYAAFDRCVHPEDRERVAAWIESSLSNKMPYDRKYRVVWPDGQVRWVHAKAKFLFDGRGQATRMVGTVMDVTDRMEIRRFAESERQYRSLVEQAQTIIARHDRQYRHLYVNAAIERVTGLKPEHYLGRTNRELGMPPELCDRWERALDDAFAQRHPVPVPFDYPSPSLGLRHYQAQFMPEVSPDGTVTAVIGMAFDVTHVVEKQREVERLGRKLEARARQAEEGDRILRAIMEHAPEGITVADAPDVTIRMVSRYGQELTGRPKDAIEGIPVGQHAEKWGLYRADGTTPATDAELPLTRATRGGEVVKDEQLVLRRPDGTAVTILCNAGPIRDAGGAITGGVIAWRDITERREVEEALHENEARFHTLADNIAQFAWMADADGSIFWYNQRWYEYTGTTLEQVQGWGWQAVHHPDHVRRVVEKISHCFRTGDVWEDTFPLRGRDGTYRWFLSRGVPIRDGRGRVTRWFGTNTDVTEQRRAEEEAEEASRAKDHFLAVLSHELRTPLTPLLATAQLLEADAALSVEQLEMVRMIRRNAELEARLIDDLLDLTRVARNKLELHLAPVDVHEKVRHVVAMCGEEVAAKRLDVTLALGATRHHVQADAARFQQVVWNLVKNAIKFTPAGGKLAVRTADAAGDHVMIEVTDNGVGIPAETLPQVFEAFEQGGRAVTRQFGGLGLGLAISRALVEMHGGTISAASDGEGKGATFTVTLPEGAKPEPTGVGHEPSGGGRLGCSILLVDDHADTRRIMSRLLKKRGCEVETAGSVAEALGLAARQKFDLLISDIGLPDASGLELMRQVRAMYGLRGIALSGYGMDEDIAKSKEAGFDAHLTKPVVLGRLEAAIRQLTR